MYSAREFSSGGEKLFATKDTTIHYFPLRGILSSGQVLVVNTHVRMLSLLAEGPLLVKQQQLTENELRVVKPLLESFPLYCPYEVLLASIFTENPTAAVIARWRRSLEDARNKGTWQQELKPLRRTLTSLRTKLHTFSLEISTVRELGCNLSSIKLRAVEA